MCDKSAILAELEEYEFTSEEQALSVKDRYLIFKDYFEDGIAIDFYCDSEGTIMYRMATLELLHAPFARLLGRLFPDMVITLWHRLDDSGMSANLIEIQHPSAELPAGTQNDMKYCWG